MAGGTLTIVVRSALLRALLEQRRPRLEPRLLALVPGLRGLRFVLAGGAADGQAHWPGPSRPGVGGD